MTALICGSMAYDTIMVFPDKFKNHILPDQVHILNVCFLVPELRREYGGCAGNIAYNLKLLEMDPYIMATVGKDFDPYAQWLDHCRIRQDHIKVIEGSYTAQAYITTDLNDNQITAFHPGAMSFSHENRIVDATGIELGLISPDGKDGMLAHAEEFSKAGIPFIFDPGQQMPMFDAEELRFFVDRASWLTVNDYECELMKQRTGWSETEISDRLDALIVTKGEKGSTFYTGGSVIEIPPARVNATRDPTGCGDAYRAGLIYGLLEKSSWETTGRIASLMGAIKIESSGTQNHSFTLKEFRDRYRDNFGDVF
jgi:adenosine kinase